MKRIITICAVILTTAGLFAQSPEKMSYQAVIRDATNNLATNHIVGMRISIIQGSANGIAVYVETQTPTTNANGLVSIEIGTGTTSDDFSGIDWANGPYFIETQTDLDGGSAFTITGTSQLLSVPYALHSKTAESVTGTITEADPIFINSEAVNISVTDISNLGNLSGINTGDQDIEGIATNRQAIRDTASKIRADIPDVSGFLTIETDPVFTAWNKNYGDLINTPNITDSIIAVIDTTTQFIRAEADDDITNEIQTLSINGNELTISGTGGNTIFLPDNGNVQVVTRSQLDALTPLVGELAYNTTDKVVLMWNGINWIQLSDSCFPQPTIANAGSDQSISSIESLITSTILEANTPVEGIGTWSVISGTGGSFADIHDPVTTFNGTGCVDYKLQWKISTSCAFSVDTVEILFNHLPTVSIAGEDIYSPEQVTVILNGNQPIESTGTWSVVSGSGGVFSDINSYNSTFTGNNNEIYVLRWTISTACNSSFDELKVYIGNVIGQYRHGGVIFYVDGTGEHGLVCAASDQNTGAEWGCYLTDISGAEGWAIGTGFQNTIDIEAGCTTAGTAADICANLTLNSYSDWFLPSREELMEMGYNKTEIDKTAIRNGGAVIVLNGYYWSSSEDDVMPWERAGRVDFIDEDYSAFVYRPKDDTNRVRAVRAF